MFYFTADLYSALFLRYIYAMFMQLVELNNGQAVLYDYAPCMHCFVI